MTIISSPLVKDNEHIIKMFLNITNCQNNKHDKINQNSIMNIKFNFKCHLLIVKFWIIVNLQSLKTAGFDCIHVRVSDLILF